MISAALFWSGFPLPWFCVSGKVRLPFQALALWPPLSMHVISSGGANLDRASKCGTSVGLAHPVVALGRGGRLLGLVVLARRLEPDPRGFGTHTQLGLRPCSFLRATGRRVRRAA